MGYLSNGDIYLGDRSEFNFSALCLKMREPSLSETDAPPRRRSLTLATPQKSFLHIF
ncbi:MAG: hypothetical protein HW383_744 [Candidatus Magasanikbacteria bacterium]|nr:hypothetical protein [Candidatus Magasanikbacteria bacterium]